MIKLALKTSIFVLLFAAITCCCAFADELTTPIEDILKSPASFTDKFVSVSGYYSGWKNAPGSPPVTRSDWVLCDDAKNAIYCTGLIPQDNETNSTPTYWKPMHILAKVGIADGRPYLTVAEAKIINLNVEKMVSVSQILFAPIEMQGQYVGLMGVLAKGYGVRGERMYLLADPTGAIKLGRLPKLFPKGTILHVRGTVRNDENGLPMIDEVEIVSSRVD
jgi:hypothetical protein